MNRLPLLALLTLGLASHALADGPPGIVRLTSTNGTVTITPGQGVGSVLNLESSSGAVTNLNGQIGGNPTLTGFASFNNVASFIGGLAVSAGSTLTIGGELSIQGAIDGDGGPITFKNPYTGNGSNLIYLATNGNDSLAQRGMNGIPFATPMAAVKASQYGDVIMVAPGLYATETNLAKNGVTWQFSGPSCVFSNFADNGILGSSNAMFTDIYGATNFAVIGYPTLIYNTGTNIYNPKLSPPMQKGAPQDMCASNACNALFFTNANTVATFQINSFIWDTYQGINSPGGGSGFVTPIYIANCSNMSFSITSLMDGFFGQTGTIITTNAGSPYHFSAENNSAIVWSLGNVTFNFGLIGQFETYGIWAYEPSPGHTNNGYFTGQELDCKIYTDGIDNSYRSWFNINWINCSNAPASYACAFYGGFNYLTAQKVSDSIVGGINVAAGGTLWANVQKIEIAGGGGANYINVDNSTNAFGGSNNVYVSVLQYTGAGNPATNVVLQGSTNILYGQYIPTNSSIVGGTSGVTNKAFRSGTVIVSGTAITYSNFDAAGNWLSTNSSFTGTETYLVQPGAGIASSSGSLTCKIIFQ